MGELASEIRRLRRARGMKVRELATAIGKSPGYVSRVETKGEVPSPQLLCELSVILECPAEHLLARAQSAVIDRAAQRVRERHESALRLFRREH